MRVTAHHSKNYNWVSVAEAAKRLGVEVKVSDADVASGKAKVNLSGGYSMRVVEERDNTTDIHVDEASIIKMIVFEKCRPSGGRILTRRQAVAFFIGEHHLDSNQRSWLTSFEVHDDGPDEKLFDEIMAPHLVAEAARHASCIRVTAHGTTKCPACGHLEGVRAARKSNIDPADLDAHKKAYLETTVSAADMAAFLCKHFRVES
jgi:hypothetical protein